LYALNKPTDGAININTTGTEYTINAFEGNFMRIDKLQGKVTRMLCNLNDEVALQH
jgi:hypothetical protein